MARIATVYEVLIASPSDVEERNDIRTLMYEWNAANSRYFGAILLPVMWEHNATPEMGDRPQAIINRQIVADADILVGVFWTRLGTPTGKADSGTAEEIQESVQAGKRVMLYFCEKKPELGNIDTVQLEALKSYRAECESKGICWSYQSSEDLHRQLGNHLTQTVRTLSAGVPRNSHYLGGQADAEAAEAARLRIDFKAFARKLTARWTAELREGPHTIADIQYMLNTAYFDLLDLVARVDPELWPTAAALADRSLAEMRTLAFEDGSGAVAGSTEYNVYLNRMSALLADLGRLQDELWPEPVPAAGVSGAGAAVPSPTDSADSAEEARVRSTAVREFIVDRLTEQGPTAAALLIEFVHSVYGEPGFRVLAELRLMAEEELIVSEPTPPTLKSMIRLP